MTHFFREKHHFDTLRQQVLPPLIAHARSGGRVRLWSAGCSNGQEPYSIAMVLAELAPDFATLDIRILATDIDPNMVQHGKAGRYSAQIVEAVPEALRKKYFTAAGEDFEVVAALRNLVHFRELNLHQPWPMKGQFDIIFCRNVVIYFDAEAQEKLWKRFESQLQPGGWIFVGHSERIPPEIGSRLTTAGVTTYRLPETGSSSGDQKWH